MPKSDNLPHNPELPHWFVVVNFSESDSSFVKAMPEDNSTSEHEDHVLDLFIKMYGHLRYGSDVPIKYKVTQRENGSSHLHDYTVSITKPVEKLEIEITRLGESDEVFKAHTLRNTASSIAKSFKNKNFFIFLPETTRPKELKEFFFLALNQTTISVPDIEDKQKMTELIRKLQIKNEPYVRLCSSTTQIHTSSRQSSPLREVVANAITRKETKHYPNVKHSDMVLLLDDQLLNYDREYIQQAQPLLAHEHLGSKFKEIYIISRKTSKMTDKNGQSEVMISLLKAAWYRPLFELRVQMYSELSRGNYPPLSY
jgi:hypothetical protein